MKTVPLPVMPVGLSFVMPLFPFNENHKILGVLKIAVLDT